jgi:hypothetical protein
MIDPLDENNDPKPPRPVTQQDIHTVVDADWLKKQAENSSEPEGYPDEPNPDSDEDIDALDSDNDPAASLTVDTLAQVKTNDADMSQTMIVYGTSTNDPALYKKNTIATASSSMNRGTAAPSSTSSMRSTAPIASSPMSTNASSMNNTAAVAPSSASTADTVKSHTSERAMITPEDTRNTATSNTNIRTRNPGMNNQTPTNIDIKGWKITDIVQQHPTEDNTSRGIKWNETDEEWRRRSDYKSGPYITIHPNGKRSYRTKWCNFHGWQQTHPDNECSIRQKEQDSRRRYNNNNNNNSNQRETGSLRDKRDKQQPPPPPPQQQQPSRQSNNPAEGEGHTTFIYDKGSRQTTIIHDERVAPSSSDSHSRGRRSDRQPPEHRERRTDREASPEMSDEENRNHHKHGKSKRKKKSKRRSRSISRSRSPPRRRYHQNKHDDSLSESESSEEEDFDMGASKPRPSKRKSDENEPKKRKDKDRRTDPDYRSIESFTKYIVDRLDFHNIKPQDEINVNKWKKLDDHTPSEWTQQQRNMLQLIKWIKRVQLIDYINLLNSHKVEAIHNKEDKAATSALRNAELGTPSQQQQSSDEDIQFNDTSDEQRQFQLEDTRCSPCRTDPFTKDKDLTQLKEISISVIDGTNDENNRSKFYMLTNTCCDRRRLAASNHETFIAETSLQLNKFNNHFIPQKASKTTAYNRKHQKEEQTVQLRDMDPNEKIGNNLYLLKYGKTYIVDKGQQRKSVYGRQ